MTYNFYIGSDNETRKLSTELQFVLDKEFPSGYTIVEGQGRWAGFGEESATITVSGIRSSFEAEDHAARLAQRLNQKSIAILRLSKRDMTFVDPIAHEEEYDIH